MANQRSWLLAPAVLTLAVSCASDIGIVITGAGYNDKVRPDLQPLSRQDRTASADFGPLRDGSNPDGTGFAAEVRPAGDWFEGSASKLAAANCLWLASAGARGPGRESVALTWELFAEYPGERQDLPGVRVQRAACTLTHPHDRIVVSAAGDLLPLAASFPPALESFPGVYSDDPLATSSTTHVSSRRLAGEAFAVLLDEIANGSAEPGFWRCPGDDEAPQIDADGDGDPANDFYFAPFTGPYRQRIVSGVNGYACPSDPARGAVGACALGCPLVAENDATYSLDLDAHLLRPNVMVALPGRTIARQTRRIAGAVYRWSTGVQRSGAEGAVRWHENFSPRAKVRAVEAFVCAGAHQPGCVELPVAMTADRLTVRQRANDGSETTWICRGGQPRPGHTVIEITSDTCTSDNGGPPAFTPTFAVNVLASLTEQDYLRAPLEWDFGANGLPEGAPPALRFTLEPDFSRPGFLRLSRSRLDFGERPIEVRAEGAVTLTNAGGRDLQLDEIALENGDVGSFDALVLADPIAVQLPIDLTRAAGKLELRADPELETLALHDITTSLDGAVLALYPTLQEGRGLDLDGLAVTVGPGGVLLRDDPQASYSPPEPPVGADPPVQRPFHAVTHVPASFPRPLAPGESLTIRAWARPRASGTLVAELAVYASQPGVAGSRQRHATRLVVAGLPHPELLALPERLFFGRCDGECTTAQPRPRRRVVLTNIGRGALERFDFELRGGGASRFEIVSAHSASATLAAGQFELIELSYHPECTLSHPRHRAQLVLHHAFGEELVELEGDSYLACNP